MTMLDEAGMAAALQAFVSVAGQVPMHGAMKDAITAYLSTAAALRMMTEPPHDLSRAVL